ncbi:sce7725 family protein [Magnetococcus sp. PR-3]|uniref:sce7725 family protein n=1 Tax=Magnetococcus sp. PR-3 TaxID=3120355 RepID=UPI002FCE2DB8
MYYPYFRGKQYELITIREKAKLLAGCGFTPIIEPVKESFKGLEKALDAICEAQGKAIVIVNPGCGDHQGSGNSIITLLEPYAEKGSISAGILLSATTVLSKAIDLLDRCKKLKPIFIHAGFPAPRELAEYISDDMAESEHIFFDNHAKMLYRKHFSKGTRVLLHDGFERQRNADYPPSETFSDLHVTYTEMGMDGFGDFLIVGDHFAEGGGPAYAIAIHLTFIDPNRDNEMFVYHFVSTTKDTPTDPAGKFVQALNKLIEKLDSGDSHLYETETIKEFRKLHSREHFPGLGYVKKLSMKHHIETLAQYLHGA